MTKIEYQNTLLEVSTILKSLNKSIVDKIPQNIKDYIEQNKSKDYIYKYDSNKRLSEQKMLKTTELYLSKLFLQYISTESEKNEVLSAINKNEEKYQEKLKEKYNPDDLFVNRKYTERHNINKAQ